MRDILVAMQRIFVIYQEGDRTADMETLIWQLDAHYDEAIRMMTGVEFWGGSGSYIDLQLYDPKTGAYSEEDNREYDILLLRLLRVLKRLGHFNRWCAHNVDRLEISTGQQL